VRVAIGIIVLLFFTSAGAVAQTIAGDWSGTLNAAWGHKNVDVEELPGLNHLFQTAKTGAPAEYAQIEETIAPQVFDKIVSWILKQPAR